MRGFLTAISTSLLLHLAASSAFAGELPSPDATYESPTIESRPSGVTIGVNDPPAGAYWRFTLDPDRAYRVKIEGRTQVGSMTLRVRRDEDSYRYQPAPHGIETLRVSGTHRLELLFYSDSPAAYELASIEAEPCAPAACPSDADLKDEILHARPRLSYALSRGEEQTAAIEILRWLAPRVPFPSGDPAPISTRWKSAAELYYDNFEAGTAGVFCEGAADMLDKLLALFGIGEAFVIDVGEVADDLTHAVVVLPTGDADDPSYSVLDPTFDSVLTVGDANRPLSWQEIAELLGAGLGEYIDASSESLSDRRIIWRTDRGIESRRCGDAPGLSSACSLAEYLSIWSPALLMHGYEASVGGFVKLLTATELYNTEAHGVPATFVALHDRAASAIAGHRRPGLAVLPVPPHSISPPRIIGSPAIGAALTAVPGSWLTDADPRTSLAWQRCEKQRCQIVATEAIYALSAADVGQRVRLIETAANAFGIAEAHADVTVPISPAPPIAVATRDPSTSEGSSRSDQQRAGSTSSRRSEPNPPRALTAICARLARFGLRALRQRMTVLVRAPGARSARISIRASGRIVVRKSSRPPQRRDQAAATAAGVAIRAARRSSFRAD